MKIGVAGRPQEGKTTLFQLLTRGHGGSASRALSQGLGTMEIPDGRVEWLAGVFAPRRTVYARMDVIHITAAGGRDLLNACRNLDAVVAVSCPPAPGEDRSQDTVIGDLETEFIVSDLVLVETRLERIGSNKAKPVSPMEVPFLRKCKDALEDDTLLRGVEFEPYERDFLANYGFFTMKPVIVAVNVPEESLVFGDYPGRRPIERKCRRRGYPLVMFSGALEEEIAILPEGERPAFLRAYGLAETGVSRIAGACYSALGYISFFTVGSDEVRAWTIAKGVTAKEAAGKIHTDLEKGFIRAEVVSFEDFRRAGSIKACRDEGCLRVEGKDYVVSDGDIVNVRFSI